MTEYCARAHSKPCHVVSHRDSFVVCVGCFHIPTEFGLDAIRYCDEKYFAFFLKDHSGILLRSDSYQKNIFMTDSTDPF